MGGGESHGRGSAASTMEVRPHRWPSHEVDEEPSDPVQPSSNTAALIQCWVLVVPETGATF